MKQSLFTLAVLLIIIGFSSCSKDNSAKITGRWQFQSAQYPTYEVMTDSVFYSFDKGVFELQTLRRGSLYAEATIGEYYLEGDSIVMTVAPSYMNIAINNEYYDWKTPQRRFAIRSLDRKSLTISVNDTTYTFRKYY